MVNGLFSTDSPGHPVRGVVPCSSVPLPFAFLPLQTSCCSVSPYLSICLYDVFLYSAEMRFTIPEPEQNCIPRFFFGYCILFKSLDYLKMNLPSLAPVRNVRQQLKENKMQYYVVVLCICIYRFLHFLLTLILLNLNY